MNTVNESSNIKLSMPSANKTDNTLKLLKTLLLFVSKRSMEGSVKALATWGSPASRALRLSGN